MSSKGSAPSVHQAPYPEVRIRPGSLADKVVLVSGASKGIGRSIALAFAEAGAAGVALLARTESALLELEREIQGKWPSVKTCVVTVDVMKDDAVTGAVARVVKELGPIDVLINNAAINSLKPFALTGIAEWWNVVEMNLRAPIFLLMTVLEGMRARNSGVVVNMASRAGSVSTPFATAYSASKAGLIRAASCIQLELDIEKKDVQLYSLHPGGVRTDMTLAALDPALDELLPGTVERITQFFHEEMNIEPELCAATCVFLASTEKAKALRGCYFDVSHNIQHIVDQADIVKREGMHSLKVEFLGGLADDGGHSRSASEPARK
ncbi:NAD-binding protein [Leucosporidium creatinivorum]|uniref:NAD-binding protein n=1 Tax=Leucosporidium creatinivorum TaxID=106004 RepID=A0A1Y2G1F9_9BASI|nr:NAD-binding protein [Leucosporidium creatinivorum]